MLNTKDQVTPGQWDVKSFERWTKLSPEQEFDLVSKVAIYFAADSNFKERARSAWEQLKKFGHPVAKGCFPLEVSNESDLSKVVRARYNALFMHLAKKLTPGASFAVGKHGVFSVVLPSGSAIDGSRADQFPMVPSVSAFKKNLGI